MLKITADTNIYISSILFGGKPEQIIRLAVAEKITMIISHDILAEIAFVLRSKFDWSNRQIDQVDQMLKEISVLVTPSQRFKVIEDDDADNRILECALEGKADFIVSGDKRHLLPLKEYQGIRIVDIASLLMKMKR